LGSLGTLAPLPTRGFRFATTDTVATVSPDGGVVGLPIAQWIIKEHDRREADGAIMRTTGAICQPRGLVVSPSNVDWFACANAILRVDERGSAQTFTMPQPRSYPTALTLGGDGAIWFAEPLKSRIGRIDAHGKLTEFAL
jgi:virginiamycin B lyase